MVGTLRRWARPALGWSVVLVYPFLMAIAIDSVRRDADGLRVLWPAVVMALPATLLTRRPVPALCLMIAGMIAVAVVLESGDASFGPMLAVVVGVGVVAAASRPRIGVGAAVAAWVALAFAANVSRVVYEGGS